MKPFRVFAFSVLSLAFLTSARAQDYAQSAEPLRVEGRITDGENKLGGSVVYTFKDNERTDSLTTDKNGKFRALLDLNSNYSIEFRHAGFVPKRIAIDTHMPKAKKGEEFELVPISMDISLLDKARYDGANTDDLDFPFALIKFNKKTFAFEQDIDYTMGMQRVNGALLLMAARTEMKK